MNDRRFSLGYTFLHPDMRLPKLSSLLLLTVGVRQTAATLPLPVPACGSAHRRTPIVEALSATSDTGSTGEGDTGW